MTATDNTPARCPCTFYERNPEAHDILLGIEDMPVPRAIELVATLISDTDMIDDVDDFGRFVGMHNWGNPDVVRVLPGFCRRERPHRNSDVEAALAELRRGIELVQQQLLSS